MCAFGGDGVIGKVMMSLILVVCAVSFIMTCWQAFVARNISSEFSEAKYLGIAVYSWLQLCLVGVPVVFLVDDHNVVAKYSLKVGLLLAVCLSMLLVVFVPMFRVKSGSHSSRRNSSLEMTMGSFRPGRTGRLAASNEIMMPPQREHAPTGSSGQFSGQFSDQNFQTVNTPTAFSTRIGTSNNQSSSVQMQRISSGSKGGESTCADGDGGGEVRIRVSVQSSSGEPQPDDSHVIPAQQPETPSTELPSASGSGYHNEEEGSPESKSADSASH